MDSSQPSRKPDTGGAAHQPMTGPKSREEEPCFVQIAEPAPGLTLHRAILGWLATNVYLLECKGELMLVDAADNAQFLVKEVRRRGAL